MCTIIFLNVFCVWQFSQNGCIIIWQVVLCFSKNSMGVFKQRIVKVFMERGKSILKNLHSEGEPEGSRLLQNLAAKSEFWTTFRSNHALQQSLGHYRFDAHKQNFELLSAIVPLSMRRPDFYSPFAGRVSTFPQKIQKVIIGKTRKTKRLSCGHHEASVMHSAC